MKTTSTSPLLSIIIISGFLVLPFLSKAQDTFSICAVDTATGQVGSAGATCIPSAGTSAIIISDVHPGVGVIHTQSYLVAGNQNYARSLMNLGLTPQQIIDSVVAHDVQNNPSIRQYGAVSLDSGGLSAAYTGVNCFSYHNHITGPNYAIQGNILLGQQILDSMEARFLNTPGSLACKLMAAMQGAKVPGADTRCMSYGISSFSAFVRVANPGDTPGNFLLDLTVNIYPDSIDPIDTLQVLFNQAGGCAVSAVNEHTAKPKINLYPNPVDEKFFLESNKEITNIDIVNPQGITLKRWQLDSLKSLTVDMSNFEKGIYLLRIRFLNGEFTSVKLIKN